MTFMVEEIEYIYISFYWGGGGRVGCLVKCVDFFGFLFGFMIYIDNML